ncbi:MAG: DNA-3-methyladenine glycosylase 2 family protein [Hyphomicrobium sp.]
MSAASNPQQTGEFRIIESAHEIRDGVVALRKACRAMRSIHDLVGDPPLRRHPAGLEGLARVVVAQQLSAASAGAIWTRTRAAIDPFTAETIARQTEASLRGAGLSQGKIRTLRAIADAITAGALVLDSEGSRDLPSFRTSLTRVRGVGPWTADIYTMFCLGHADAFAPGDLALQLAAQSALRLDARPSPAELESIAARWRPWRGVAARLLWSYYAHNKTAQAANRP